MQQSTSEPYDLSDDRDVIAYKELSKMKPLPKLKVIYKCPLQSHTNNTFPSYFPTNACRAVFGAERAKGNKYDFIVLSFIDNDGVERPFTVSFLPSPNCRGSDDEMEILMSCPNECRVCCSCPELKIVRMPDPHTGKADCFLETMMRPCKAVRPLNSKKQVDDKTRVKEQLTKRIEEGAMRLFIERDQSIVDLAVQKLVDLALAKQPSNEFADLVANIQANVERTVRENIEVRIMTEVEAETLERLTWLKNRKRPRVEEEGNI